MNNLPAPITDFIGRETEVAAARHLLLHDSVRLVTMTGPGGVGKSRLALEVANAVAHAFADGAHFISLAAVRDPNLVTSTIAQTLRLRESGARTVSEALNEYLSLKQLLLVLDNFEQILAAAPRVTELLEQCPRLKVLVTSRAVLRLRGEYEFQVPPLALPDLEHSTAAKEVEQSPAVALFFMRARTVKPDWRSDDAALRAVAEICGRLDGLPLAIELAAARIKLLPPQELLARLEHPMDVLTQGARDVPARQQSLRHTLDWSYGLLDPREQQLFRCMGVFVGGCTFEAVDAINRILGASGTLDLIASLIDNSLLRAQAASKQETRLTMLETIREYARERLQASGEAEAMQRTHAEYYLQLAESAEPNFTGAQQQAWSERLERDHDNLRAALSLAVARGESEIALRLSGALWRFWFTRGYLSEGRKWLEQSIALASGELSRPLLESLVGAKAVNGAAYLASNQSDYVRAVELGTLALELARHCGNRASIAAALSTLANANTWLGNYESARQMYEQCIVIYRELGDEWGTAISTAFVANVCFFQGDYDAAQPLLVEALAAFRALGDKWGSGVALYVLGFVNVRQNEVAAARAHLEESYSLLHEIGDRRGLTRALVGLGEVARAERALTQARTRFEQALHLSLEVGDKWSAAQDLSELAGIATAEGQPETAARLFGAADALRQTIRAPLPVPMRATYEHDVAVTRARLGKKAFVRAWAEGHNQNPEQALAMLHVPQTKERTDLSQTDGAPGDNPSTRYRLSQRELQVLQLVASGLTDAQVAETLVISVRTVQHHLQSIYEKMGVNSRTAAARLATDHQVI